MDIEYEGSVDYSVDEIFDAMSKEEKEGMYDLLLEELEKGTRKETEEFAVMDLSGKKRFLCDCLDVPSYYDNVALRNKLEEIINAL